MKNATATSAASATTPPTTPMRDQPSRSLGVPLATQRQIKLTTYNSCRVTFAGAIRCKGRNRARQSRRGRVGT